MESLSTSLILLLLALVLLWLAVTDRLSRVLDAFDVLRGINTNATGVAKTLGSAVVPTPGVAFRMPSLPPLGRSVQVPAV